MTIIAKRQPGDKPGDDIVDAILTTPESQLERGRQEINKNSSDRIIHTISTLTGQSFTPGEQVTVVTDNNVFTGKCRSFSIEKTGPDISTQVEIEAIK